VTAARARSEDVAATSATSSPAPRRRRAGGTSSRSSSTTAAQGVTDVVARRGPRRHSARQILLQGHLGVPTPRYLHTPLVLAASGEKLSKQTGARPLGLERPLDDLRCAAAVLGLAAEGTGLADWLGSAVAAWRSRWPLP
jgi:glutamyl-Q tRNA(Asp) synthetase